MIQRLFVLTSLSIIFIGSSASVRPTQSASQQPCAQDHNAWVTHALEQMETIKPGMTREDLLKVFTTEGGLSTGLRRTFVSRDCPYFKVAAEFEPVARPGRDDARFLTSVEDSRDIICLAPDFLDLNQRSRKTLESEPPASRLLRASVASTH